ncbi:MAG: P27 family phage terminase small subunit, partial [Synergistaceae bacterium]|nr:P27 family phage terminase small subunit [Synergistaceae bacterium]
GYPQQVPYISIAQQYLKLMQQFAEQFGLTPAARSRIIAGNGEGKAVDDLDELLGEG